jgi:beta-phosphoglucomutase-like phosphatase (HAD superfamily)
VLLDFDGLVGRLSGVVDERAVRDRCSGYMQANGVRVGFMFALAATPAEWIAAAHERAQRTGSRLDGEHAGMVDTIVRDAEATAAASLDPTPGIGDVLTACATSGRRIAVVGAHDVVVMDGFLRRHGLRDRVEVVTGRSPEPGPLLEDLFTRVPRQLDVGPGECVLVSEREQFRWTCRPAGVAFLGVASGDTARKHLAWADDPDVAVVTNPQRLIEAFSAS